MTGIIDRAMLPGLTYLLWGPDDPPLTVDLRRGAEVLYRVTLAPPPYPALVDGVAILGTDATERLREAEAIAADIRREDLKREARRAVNEL